MHRFPYTGRVGQDSLILAGWARIPFYWQGGPGLAGWARIGRVGQISALITGMVLHHPAYINSAVVVLCLFAILPYLLCIHGPPRGAL